MPIGPAHRPLLRPIYGGDYRVLSPLGEGGMGTVYIAEQLSTGLRRALKLMRPHLLRLPRQRARFEQEARIGARIHSDHVVQVIGAGFEESTEEPWIAMELLDGEDLAQRMRQRGRLSFDELLPLYAELCHALAAAHRVAIVHRDLKPANIFLAQARLLGRSTTVKVLDFGIAHVLSENAEVTDRLGSPLWMAPEQAALQPQITPATDVWALGLIAFWLLTGRSYWKAAEAGAWQLQRELALDPHEPASQRARAFGITDLLPPHFDEWLRRCLAIDPAERFADAGQAFTALAPMAVWGESTIPDLNPVLAPVGTSGALAPPAEVTLAGAPALAQLKPLKPPVGTGLLAGRWLPPPAADAPTQDATMGPVRGAPASTARSTTDAAPPPEPLAADAAAVPGPPLASPFTKTVPEPGLLGPTGAARALPPSVPVLLPGEPTLRAAPPSGPAPLSAESGDLRGQVAVTPRPPRRVGVALGVGMVALLPLAAWLSLHGFVPRGPSARPPILPVAVPVANPAPIVTPLPQPGPSPPVIKRDVDPDPPPKVDLKPKPATALTVRFIVERPKEVMLTCGSQELTCSKPGCELRLRLPTRCTAAAPGYTEQQLTIKPGKSTAAVKLRAADLLQDVP